MAFSKSFILSLLVVATMSSMNVEARRLLQVTTQPYPYPKSSSLPKPSMPHLPEMPSLPKTSLPPLTSTIPPLSSLKGSLPPLHTSIPSLPKHIKPFPFTSTDAEVEVKVEPPVSAPAPAPVADDVDTPKSPPSFLSYFPFFSKSPSTSKP